MLSPSLFKKQKPSSYSCTTLHNHRPFYGTITILISLGGAIGLDQGIQETSGVSQKQCLSIGDNKTTQVTRQQLEDMLCGTCYKQK